MLPFLSSRVTVLSAGSTVPTGTPPSRVAAALLNAAGPAVADEGGGAPAPQWESALGIGAAFAAGPCDEAVRGSADPVRDPRPSGSSRMEGDAAGGDLRA